MATKQISFEVTRDEVEIINKIAKRASAVAAELDVDYDVMTAHMDITATHANGCPLKLQELLEFPKGDFAHDVFGIRRHIDRKTGKLGGCFLPRCAQPAKA